MLASEVVRRHRLAERFLTDILDLSWAEAHHEAGKWEHVISEAVEAAMDRLLGSPTTCPHGNPIPGSAYVEPDSRPLSDGRRRRGFTVSRIPEELEFTPGLLEFLEASALQPGHDGTITAASPDGTMTVEIDGRHVGVGRSPAPASWSPRDLRGASPGPLLARVLAAVVVGLLGDDLRHVHDHGSGRRVVPTTEFVPTGSTGELLDQLGTETAGLSDRLVDNDGQRQALVRIEANWALARPGSPVTAPSCSRGSTPSSTRSAGPWSVAVRPMPTRPTRTSSR